MPPDLSMLIIGWLLGLIGSLVTGVLLVALEGIQDGRLDARRQQREDIRVARNWVAHGKPSLRGFCLAGANLSGKHLCEADLEDASLKGAQMWGTDLRGANLIRASFRRARLKGVDFRGANMTLADFTGAEIRESDFSGASLKSARLAKARRIVGCTWAGVEVDEKTELGAELREEILDQSRHDSNP